ncbi:MAG TPA: hypothetical protein VN682_04895 [Terriglobales bacterium]|nr:hypothetical protein [Terriglobales bacterium]
MSRSKHSEAQINAALKQVDLAWEPRSRPCLISNESAHHDHSI